MKKLYISLLALLAAAAITLPAFAWLAGLTVQEPKLHATAMASYFDGGSGTADDPYILSSYQHVYNMAWLQNINYFGNDTTVYFELKNDIVMPEGYAIPPIGTADKPFTGHFDGKGHTISNLWISTDPGDWREQPANYDTLDFSGGVGLFGYTKKAADRPAYVGDFLLKDIRVTSSIDCQSVGLIAGQAGASMSKIGVDGGQFDFKGTPTVNSDYTLLGKINGLVWSDQGGVPGSNGGGELAVKPSEHYSYYNEFVNSNMTETPIYDASENTAFVTKSMSLVNVNGGLKGLHIYNSTSSFANDSGKTVGRTSSQYINYDANNASDRLKEFYTQYTDYQSSAKVMTFTSQPDFSSGNEHPANCVWFKPLAAGTAALAFLQQDQSSVSYMSVYRFKRDENNNFTNIEEVTFVLPKNPVGNKHVGYYELVITQEEVDAGYEYAIGKSTTNGNEAGFFYMRLAGTSDVGGDVQTGNGKQLERIEFVPDATTAVICKSAGDTGYEEEYMVSNTLLRFSGTASEGETLTFYECQTSISPHPKGYVHYSSSGSGITIEDRITNGESTSGAECSHQQTS